MTLDGSAMREAVSDVTIGFFMAFPIAFVVLSVTTWLELSVPVTAGVQTLVFTVVALVRKYLLGYTLSREMRCGRVWTNEHRCA